MINNNREWGKFCSKQFGELEGFIEAKADTSYSNIVYNCTQCSVNYLLQYSKYYKRSICKNLLMIAIKSKI